MSARVISNGIGSSIPTRDTVMFTLLPFGPRSTETALSVVQPRVDSPSTRMIRSPACSPTRSAGEFGSGESTVSQPSRTSISMPSPPYSPCVWSRRSS